VGRAIANARSTLAHFMRGDETLPPAAFPEPDDLNGLLAAGDGAPDPMGPLKAGLVSTSCQSFIRLARNEGRTGTGSDRPQFQEVAERIGGPLTGEQNDALRVLTEQLAGRHVIGVAVSGSTAERLGADSPALAGQTMTLDALVARADRGTVEVVSPS
jgi:hypothetical protein